MKSAGAIEVAVTAFVGSSIVTIPQSGVEVYDGSRGHPNPTARTFGIDGLGYVLNAGKTTVQVGFE